MRVALTVIFSLALLAISGPAAVGAEPQTPELPPEVEAMLPEVASASGVSIDRARANVYVKEATAPFLAAIKSHPDVFAVARFNAQDGSYTVFTTLAPDQARAKFGHRANVVFEQAGHSQVELEEITHLAVGISVRYDGSVSLIYADGTTDEVVVYGSPELSEAEVQEYATSIGIDMPVRLEVSGPDESHTCDTRNNCTPWRGGIALERNGQPWCTSTGWAKRNAERVMITAGHCGDNVTWKHNGVTVGTEVKNSLWDSEFYDYLWLRWAVNSDSERIDVVDTKEDWANNWVFRNNSQKDYALIGTQGAGGIDVGDTVCMTGMISGTKCGQVQNADATSCCVHPPESRYDAYLYHMISATYTSNPGDSGGPVYGLGLNGLKWVGVNHGTGNGTGLASRQANVVTDLNLDAWCTVSDC